MSEIPVTPSAVAAIVIELCMMLAGLALLWKHVVSPAARARPQPARLAVWAVTWVDVLFFIWYIILCALIFQAFTVYALRKVTPPVANLEIFAGLAAQLGALAGLVAFRYLRPPRPTFDFSDPAPGAGQLLPFTAGLATFLIVLPVLGGTAVVWQGVLGLAGVELVEQPLVDVFAGSESPAFSALLILFAVVIAPLTEELIFRRGLFRFARQHLPRWAALLVPSLLFASLHMNLASFAPLLVLGIVFSLAYERTGSIAVVIIAHGIFNLNSVFLIYAGVNQ